jgi:hypothetical protein
MGRMLVSISGFSSEAGKTTLLCRLLEKRPGWEAIKMTRGHYRSCGKDPEACCVSGLLGERPLVLSGRDATLKSGKDTGRYWEAGASNVHWVIGTDNQIEAGFAEALGRVTAEGVFIEGNSFLKFTKADYSIMVASPLQRDIKSSALAILPRMDALFISQQEPDSTLVDALFERLEKRGSGKLKLPVYFSSDCDRLSQQIIQARLRPGCSFSPGS